MNNSRIIKLRFKKLDKRAVIPSYAHPGDVAMDMTVISVEYNAEKDCYIYGTGLACETKLGRSMFCFPRSSIYQFEYYQTNHVGIVDPATYRGEIKFIVRHRDSIKQRVAMAAMDRWDCLKWYEKLKPGSYAHIKQQLMDEFLADPLKYAPYKPGEAAFQIWMAEVLPVEVKEVKTLSETSRGTGGFGSSGKVRRAPKKTTTKTEQK